MEKQKKHARSKSCTVGIFSSFLKSTASFSFAGRRSSFNHRNAFSGPIVSIVPAEARRKGRPGPSGYRTPEPASPKVSCIGQIKQKKMSQRSKSRSRRDAGAGLPPKPPEGCRRPGSLMRRVFGRSSSRSRDHCKGRPPPAVVAPAGVAQMKRFTSGRGGALKDFDWREVDTGRGLEEEEEDEEVFVAHSAPLVLGGGVVGSEPRKEMNLWRRRRPMAPPSPLQLS